MKLTADQIKSLSAKSTTTSRARVADVMITAGRALTKTEIAKLSDIAGTRPEHNVSSQFTYLRSEGYLIKEVEDSAFMILALPDGTLPDYAQVEVAKMLGISVEALTKTTDKK